MNREERIEQMTRDIKKATFGINDYTLSDLLSDESIHLVVAQLVDAGWRKDVMQ